MTAVAPEAPPYLLSDALPAPYGPDPAVFGPYGTGNAPPTTNPLACIPCDVRWSGWDSPSCWSCGQPGIAPW